MKSRNILFMAAALVLLTAFSGAYSGVGVTLTIDAQDNVKVVNIGQSFQQQVDNTGYEYAFFDSSGKEVKKGKIKVGFERGFTKLSEVIAYLSVESSDVGELTVSNAGGKEIFRQDLAKLICNNDGSCAGFENNYFCPSDCPANSKDNYCNAERNAVCDIDCGSLDIDCTCGNSVCDQNEKYYRGSCPKDCNETIIPRSSNQDSGSSNQFATIGVFLLAIAVIGGLYYLLTKKKAAS